MLLAMPKILKLVLAKAQLNLPRTDK